MTHSRIVCLATVVSVVLLLTISCEEELETLGVTGELPPASSTAIFDVFATTKSISAVQTNPLPLYQLGTFTDPVYGTRRARIVSQVQLPSTNPTFGALSQDEEHSTPENETVTAVHLYIPYQQSPAFTQQDEDGRFDLDSIYGDKSHPFNLTVQESTYFLGDFDPDNIDQTQEYYSDEDFSNAVGATLFSRAEPISDKEIVIFEDEASDQVKTRLDPGIRVPLDNTFFQQRVLNQEGLSPLQSQANFTDFFRGIQLSIADSDALMLMLLLDLTQANITITYEYQDLTTGETVEEDFVLPLLVNNSGTIEGNAVNTWENDAFPNNITEALDTDENASRLYVKGGGTFTEMQLFGETDEHTTAIIDTLRANNWIITEANLVFHVDTDALDDRTVMPPRLYVYNAETEEPLYNTATEQSTSSNPLGLFTVYDGRLNDAGTQYKVRITEYLNKVIKDNAGTKLALTSTANIAITTTQKARGRDEEFNVPIMAAISPLGTVLFGSGETVNDDKKLKLEIRYKEVD